MLQITNGREATLLQLQYVTDSVGLRRTYTLDGIDDDRTKGAHDAATAQAAEVSLSALPRPVPSKAVDKAVDKAIQRPDIEWHPSYKTYQDRVARLAEAAHNRPKDLPEGFPPSVSSPRAWTGTDYADPERYLVRLSAADVDEIKVALEHFKGLDGDNGPDDVSVETFPLPALGPRLAAVAQNLHRGTGFNVLRGLDPTDLSPLDNVLVYLGVTSYIAPIRGCQDYDGRMIVHIKDIDKDLPDASGRPSPYTNRAQPFHTDMCDILSMYVLDTAETGGESLLSSSATIYNELAATRPDLIHVLADDKWIHDHFDKTKASWTCRPLLYNFRDHGPGFLYSRRPLTGAPFSPHHPDVPAMTEEQAEAIDAVHFAAVKHQLAIRLQPGDIEIFNNMALFHARNAFADRGPECSGRVAACDGSAMDKRSMLSGRRHMLRLWLRSADEDLVWETPAPLKHNSELTYGDSEAMRIARWDVHRAPPVNRVLTRHFVCS